jgi:hypothetical protein
MLHVDFNIPADMPEEEAWETIRKALKRPLSKAERAEGERDFATCQQGFHAAMSSATHVFMDAQVMRLAAAGNSDAEAAYQRIKRQVQWQMRTRFNRCYDEAFLAGKRMGGSDKRLAPNEREIIRRLANNEAEYALNMLLDIETGEYSMNIDNRLQLYTNALSEVRWLGYLYADLSQDRYVRWTLSGDVGTSCVDCAYMAGKMGALAQNINRQVDPQRGPTKTQAKMLDAIAAHRDHQGGRWGTGVYRVQELVRMAIVPQSATLACTTNCHCTLQEARKPRKRAKHAEQKSPFKSLWPKAKTMDRRTTLPAERARLSELADRWELEHVGRGAEPHRRF